MVSKRPRGPDTPKSSKQRLKLVTEDGSSLLNDEDHAIVPDIDKQSFDNLVKEVTANHITDTDVWNVRIIDYFAEMKHLRSNRDGSINFQVASSALHGCVSVLSKKIDSTVSGANNLMNGLSIDSTEKNDLDNDDDAEDPEFKLQKRKRVTKIETDPLKVAITSFNRIKASDKDQIFEMRDPVFKKFIATFDEGGTKALLTNTLRMDKTCRVCIDDVAIHESSNCSNTETPEQLLTNEASVNQSEINDDIKSESDNDEMVDLNLDPDNIIPQNLSNKLETTASNISRWLNHNLSSILGFESLNLCSEISDVKKSVTDEDYGREFVKSSMDKLEKDQDQLQIIEPNIDYDIEDYVNEDTSAFFAPSFSSENHETDRVHTPFNSQDNRTAINFDSNASNYAMSPEDEKKMEAQQMEAMRVLDHKFINRTKRPQWKNDWKIRLIKTNKQDTTSLTIIGSNNGTETKEMKETSPTVAIDLNEDITEASNLNRKPAIKGSTIDFVDGKDDFTLFEKPNIKIERNIAVRETTLHDENTWSSERLVRSFIKPKRRYRNMFIKQTAYLQPIEADHSFWAKQYNDTDASDENIDVDAADFLREAMDDGVETKNDVLAITPYEDMDIANANGYDFDADLDFNVPSSSFAEDGASTAQQTQFSNTQSGQRKTIQHARRSKRVDVRLLKKNLSDAIHHVHLANENSDFQPIATDEVKRKQKVNIRLSEIVRNTAIKYEGVQRDEISTSFYFICMLHLANEQGFSVENTKDNDDVIITGDTTLVDDL